MKYIQLILHINIYRWRLRNVFFKFSLLTSLYSSKMYFICYIGSVQRTLNYIWKNHVKLQPKQLLMQFVNVFLSILLKCLKCHLKKIYLKHFITGQLLWQFKFFHMANSWQYYASFSVPLHFYINMNFQKQI